MPGALFSRLNRSFGPPAAIPARRSGALEKIETTAKQYPLQLATVAEIAPKMGDKTVIVIGAGFAGLTAGWWLATHGFDVTVLEARNRIGGRVHTKRANQRVLECGGELIGRNHANWLRLASYFGLGLSPISTDENYAAESLKSPMLLGGVDIGVRAQEKLYDEMRQALRTLDPLAAKVKALTPWKSKLKQKDKVSVGSWIKALKRLKISDRTIAALRFQLECDQTIPVGEQSLLGLLAAVNGGSLTDLSDPKRQEPSEFWTDTEVYRCTEGNDELAERLRKEIEACRGQVLLEAPASKITLDSNDVCVHTERRDHKGSWVVVAVPPSCWNTINFPFDTTPYRISMGPAFKFLAETKKRFWMRDSLSPNGTDDHFGMVWEGTDNQDGSRGEPELTVFAGGPAADKVRNLDPEKHFRDGLQKLYKGFEAEVGKTTPVNWTTEEWTMGGYSCPTVGQVTTAAERLYKPHGRLVWAGEHACMGFFGYMESALQSGMHAARIIADEEGIPEVRKICDANRWLDS